MSTKTGYAFFINPKYSVYDLPLFMFATNKKNLECRLEDIADSLVNSYYKNNQLTNFEHYVETISYNEEEIKKHTPNADVSIIFNKSKKMNKETVRFVNYSKESVEVFAQTDFVEGEATYFNNTDSQVDEIGKEEWHYRRDYWDSVKNQLGVSASNHISLISKISQMNLYRETKKLWVEPEDFVSTSWRQILVNELSKRYKEFFPTENLEDKKAIEYSDMEDIINFARNSYDFVQLGTVSSLGLEEKQFSNLAKTADKILASKTIPYRTLPSP